LPEIERDWKFKRDSVPEYIRLTVGRAARERSIAKLTEDYSRSPAERFKLCESAIKVIGVRNLDPDTWNPEFFCFIRVPLELSGEGIPIYFAGSRDHALTDLFFRPWFFDPRAEILHGEAALTRAKELWNAGVRPCRDGGTA
jgi:hypothetical protein